MNRRWQGIAIQGIALALGVIIILPILYGLYISFVPQIDLIRQATMGGSVSYTLDNYVKLFAWVPMARYLFNSVIVTVVSTLTRIVVALSSAYALVFMRIKHKSLIFALISFAMLVPGDVMLIPNYRIVASLGMVNTYLGICSVSLVSMQSILLVRQNFLNFPRELYDAARLDGCDAVQFALRILAPMCAPVIITIGLTSFVSLWNDYVWPLVITNTTDMRTVQIGITLIKSRDSTDFGPTMAGAMVSLIPTLVLFLIFQRQLIEGMTKGAVG